MQDDWRLSPKLTISPGLRYEYTAIPEPSITNPAYPQTGRIPDTNLNFAPRFGMAYALNSKTVLRASYGTFFNRYTTSTIENFFLTNGLYQASHSLRSNVPAQVGAGPVFHSSLASQPNVLGSSSIIYADRSWRNPYSQQFNAAIERELAKDTTLAVSYIWGRGLHLLVTRDANVQDLTTSYTFPILDSAGNVTGSYTTPLYTKRIDYHYGTMELSVNWNRTETATTMPCWSN